jgi:hypothetical protein
LVGLVDSGGSLLLAWLSLSYATQHARATRVSLLLGQAVLTAILAWLLE